MSHHSDAQAIEKFINSLRGQQELLKMKKTAVGRTVVEVRFENHEFAIAIYLGFEDDSALILFQPLSLLEELWEESMDEPNAEEACHG